MKKGTKVKWVTASGIHGTGVTIDNETNGHVPVAVDAPVGEEHRVIWCTITWLTEYE